MTPSMNSDGITRRVFLGTTARTAAALTVAGAASSMAGGCSHGPQYSRGDGRIDLVIENQFLSLPAAIRSMTSLSAEQFNIRNRGRLATGHYAHLAVIDLDRIADHATCSGPLRNCTGIEHLLVNGVVAIANGVHTGDCNGHALRRNT